MTHFHKIIQSVPFLLGFPTLYRKCSNSSLQEASNPILFCSISFFTWKIFFWTQVGNLVLFWMLRKFLPDFASWVPLSTFTFHFFFSLYVKLLSCCFGQLKSLFLLLEWSWYSAFLVSKPRNMQFELKLHFLPLVNSFYIAAGIGH